MTGALLLSTTLPTIVGMGVVSKTTEIMFDKSGRRVRGRKGKARPKSATLVVGVSPKRAGAERYAARYRRELKSEGKPYVGRVKIKKVQGGYAAVYLRG